MCKGGKRCEFDSKVSILLKIQENTQELGLVWATDLGFKKIGKMFGIGSLVGI